MGITKLLVYMQMDCDEAPLPHIIEFLISLAREGHLHIAHIIESSRSHYSIWLVVKKSLEDEILEKALTSNIIDEKFYEFVKKHHDMTLRFSPRTPDSPTPRYVISIDKHGHKKFLQKVKEDVDEMREQLSKYAVSIKEALRNKTIG